MNVMGLIFANDAALGTLTEHRTMASLPFGGRYRQVDFALSNLSCAGMRHIGIITRHHYQSLINHVGSGEEWGLELEEGGLEYLTPFASSSTDTYRGKLESLYAAMNFLQFGPEAEYVVMVDSAVLTNIDLNKVVAHHIESGKDVTIVTKAGIADGKRQLDLALKLDEKGEIRDIAVDYVAPEGYLASLDIFVVRKDWLIRQVKEHIARNLYHMDRDLVLGLWKKGEITINLHSYEGEALYNDTIEEYFSNSMKLICKETRHDLFAGNHPVYTKVRDRVPCYYGDQCAISDCIVADGCMLEGEAQNCVLFRQVSLAPGAQVRNCVIMNDARIGEGAYLENVILDKDVTVRPGAKLVGTPGTPIVIRKGDTV